MKRPPVEVELWTSEPTRRFEEVGPVAVRLRAVGDLTPELERRLDRRLARAAFGGGAEAVLRVQRSGPTGAGTARAFVARGVGVRWSEPPPPSSRPGTAESSVRSMSPASSFVVPTVYSGAPAVVRDAPPLETLVRDLPSSIARTTAQRLATIAASSPTRHRAARALSGALESRAKQLAVTPEAKARLERWAQDAREELERHPPASQPQSTTQIPSGCAFLILGLLALVVFNMFGNCVRMMTQQ